MTRYTETGYCRAWGGQKNARRVHGLTKDERQQIRAGDEIRLAGCPEYQGHTERRIVAIGEGFYCRMPA